MVEDNEDISRNINWSLRSFGFDNLFNYGENNNINFEELSGIVGVFGKNFSGKSSVIDAVLWTMFNSTSKNERKNINVINQNKDCAAGQIEIEIGDRLYKIERTAAKYVKRLKGEESNEAKTELNFEVFDKITGETTSLNGLTRSQTDANIRKQFGTLDDFSVSSLSSQHGALTFIDEGSTRRKEIIAKFLDLELFEQKFKLAKEDSVDLKGALKRLSTRNYDDEILSAQQELSETRKSLQHQQDKCLSLKDTLSMLTAQCTGTQAKIDSIPAEVIDIAAINHEIRTKENQITALKIKIGDNEKELKTKQGVYKKVVDFLKDFELEKYETLRQKIGTNRTNLKEKEDNLDKLLDTHSNILKKEKLLEEHEYDPECKYCCENEFVKEAHTAVTMKSPVETEQKEVLRHIEQISREIKALNPQEVEIQLEKYENVQKSKHRVSSTIADLNLEVERNKNTIHTIDVQMTTLRSTR